MTFKKILKRIFITLLVLLILISGSVFVIIAFYKKDLCNMFIEQLKIEYGLIVDVKNVNISLLATWPKASINLEDVHISSDVSNAVAPPVFTAKQLFLSFDLQKLFHKEFIINSVALKNAELNLIRENDIETNFKFKLKKDSLKTGKSAISFDIAEIKVENTRLHFVHKEKDKSININFVNVTVTPKQYKDGFTGTVKGEVFVQELLFKREKGPFLKEKSATIDLKAVYFKETNAILVRSNSTGVIDDQVYQLGAYVDLSKEPRQLILSAKAKQLKWKVAYTLLNPRVQRSLSQFAITKPLDASMLLIVQLGKGVDPQMLIEVRSKNNDLTIGDSKVPYSNISFHGRVINVALPGQDANFSKARIIFDSIKGNIYDFPFTAKVTLNNLKNPYLNINGKIDIDARKIKFKPGQKFILFGHCYTEIAYEGPAPGLKKDGFLDAPMKLNAVAHFDKFNFRTSQEAPPYVINGLAKVNNRDLTFDRLGLVTKGGNFKLDGHIRDFTPFACGFTDGFEATLNAHTDLFDIGPLLVKQDSTKKKKTLTEQDLQKMTKSDFKFAVNIDAKKFLIRNMVATKFSASVNYDNADIWISKLDLTTCKGTLNAKARLHDFSGLKADIVLKDADVKQLFEDCEEFGQKAITSKNLQGDLSGKLGLTATFTDDFKIEPGSLVANVEVKLKNGHLIDYEPLQNISNFIFRNRNFQDITFTEINETLHIENNKMKLDEMELASNVINMYIEGIYDFKGESSINMRIPWSNLKRRGKNYIPKSLGEDGKDARGLKLNYYGFPNKMKVRLGNK